MKADMTTRELLRLQRDERTLCEVYRRLAGSERDPFRRRVLLGLMLDEQRHYAVLKGRTGRETLPHRSRVWAYGWLARMLGPTFVVRQMKTCEKRSAERYARYAGDETFRRIVREERRHEEQLVRLAEASPLSYIGSVVLGLNDALVEFTGALSGFTLALDNTRLVALTGGITGIAAALSMAASEYLSTRSGKSGQKCPLRAALYTGSAYIVTVTILIIPYLVCADAVAALCIMLLAALLVIALFNYYYAVIRCESFRRRFFEMAFISFGIAAISFMIGYLLKFFAGVDLFF